MWNNKTVAVIFPVSGEKKSVKNVILEFDSTGFVDEIIVVGSNINEEIETQIKRTRARLIKTSSPERGEAIKTGIKSTKADLLLVTEANGRFEGKDLVKFLSYSDDFDMVFGSRTHVPLIHNKTQIPFSGRIIDVMLGKLISLLFISPPLTDAGCIYRLTNRKAWQKIIKESKYNSPLFMTEWLLLAAKNRIRFIQIPVNFKAQSSHSSSKTSFFEQSRAGLIIFLFILKIRLAGLFGKTLNKLNPQYP